MCFLRGDDISLQSLGSCGFDVDVPPMSHLSQLIESPAAFINKQLCIVKQSHKAFERHIFSFYLDIAIVNTHFQVSPSHIEIISHWGLPLFTAGIICILL